MQQAQPQFSGLLQAFWNHRPADPPPLKYTFDGDPKKVTIFLNNVQVNCYEWAYLYKAEMIDDMAANLEGEAVEWVAGPWEEQAPEL